MDVVIRAAQRTLMTAAIEALVADLRPDACVRFESGTVPGSLSLAVRVELPDKGRWLLVLPNRSGVDEARVALVGGAWGIARFDADPREFELAFFSMVDGTDPHLPLDLARGLLLPPADRAEAPVLTRREREVLSLVAKGASNQEIARELYISTHTVRAHLGSMCAKLEASSRVKLLVRARALGLPEALEPSQTLNTG